MAEEVPPAGGAANRNARNNDNIPVPQLHVPAVNIPLQAPVVDDAVLSFLSDLPEQKLSVTQSVIWPKLFCH
ncbi:hypothetical protein M758_1G099500 [Ceratodon purpureus]|uniref:Uncharacterized protein n=1 Tax=Ceratodon purpureus TaxID=3225 RepID=A0A8T0J4M0_CERPU|nr:hypothetical protein KC19_1G110200 [Ceratodon purpureus]KAG0629385.1 hypothetical protein M758_1G099500 [Ceratodon purpureus]